MKSKKNLARKILCGLLAAGIVGMSGSAMAAYAKKSYNKSISVNNDLSVSNEATSKGRHYAGIQFYKGTSNASKDVVIKLNKNIDSKSNNKFDDNSSISSAVYTFTSKTSKDARLKIYLGSKETEHINLTATGNKSVMGIYIYNDWHSTKPLTEVNGAYMEICSKNLNINVTSDTYYAHGIYIGNNTTDLKGKESSKLVIKAENTNIDVSSGVKIDPTDGDNHAIGIAAYSQGEVEINGNLTVNADTAINTRGNSSVVINKDGTGVVQLNGDINFNYDEKTSKTTVDSKVDINLNNAKSYLTGSIAVNGQPLPPVGKDEVHGMDMSISNGAAWNMTGDSFVNTATIANDGSINLKDNVNNFKADAVALNNGNLNLQGNGQNVTIANLNGDGGTVNTNSVNNAVRVTNIADNTTVKVNGTSEITDKIASGKASLQDLANVVKGANTEENKSLASKVTSDANDIIGGYSADLDNNGQVVTQSIQTPENPTNRAISDMASISLMTWRQENNDMNKRLGELRDSKGEHGAWARMARGESKYGAQNVKNQYNYYQVGYDEKLSVNPNWTVGVALTRTEGNSTFATGSGENKHTGFAVYGSYLNDNGSFIDLIAKYARMDNDYKTVGAGVGNADYETNGYSLSAEYGKRFTKDNGFWIEPQVELTYGTVGSATYTTSKGATVYQESVDSLVGRLGFSLGKNIKQGNVYVRASYLYDFDGETKAFMSKADSGSASFEQDLGGGWWEVGVGTNLNLSEATHLYFDVEKTYGGNVATPWQWNAGVRWSF